MTKVHAVRVHELGGPEVLRYEEVEVGAPGPGEARVRHTAIGLNVTDVHFRTGRYPLKELPHVIGMEAAGKLLGQPFGMRQEGAHFLPDRQVHQIGPDLRILTDALAAKAVRVCAQAAVIGIRARRAFPRTGTEALPVEGRATVMALEPALQQRPGAAPRLAGERMDPFCSQL